MARLEKPSLSPPCRWHMRECTMLRQASADVGAVVFMAGEKVIELNDFLENILTPNVTMSWKATESYITLFYLAQRWSLHKQEFDFSNIAK